MLDSSLYISNSWPKFHFVRFLMKKVMYTIILKISNTIPLI